MVVDSVARASQDGSANRPLRPGGLGPRPYRGSFKVVRSMHPIDHLAACIVQTQCAALASILCAALCTRSIHTHTHRAPACICGSSGSKLCIHTACRCIRHAVPATCCRRLERLQRRQSSFRSALLLLVREERTTIPHTEYIQPLFTAGRSTLKHSQRAAPTLMCVVVHPIVSPDMQVTLVSRITQVTRLCTL